MTTSAFPVMRKIKTTIAMLLLLTGAVTAWAQTDTQAEGSPELTQAEELTEGEVVPVMDSDRIIDPVFTNVIIDATRNNVSASDGSVTFKGTYDYMPFTDTDRSVLFLGSNSSLYWPQSGASRAYFQLGKGITASDIAETRLTFGEEETLGIERTGLTPNSSPEGEGSIYTIHGVKLDKTPTRKGLYIYKGRKVVVK